jgi:hypothetical protein
MSSPTTSNTTTSGNTATQDSSDSDIQVDTPLPGYNVPQKKKNPFGQVLPSTTDSSSSPPDPSTSIFTFFLITLIYFVAKYQTPDSMSTMLNIIYIVAIVSTQISINSALAKSVCNNPNSTNTGILATIFPMLFIFGLLELMLSIYPGWVEPFSNTFGYGIVKLSGLSNTIKSLIRDPESAKAGRSISTALNNIYNDPSIFINQFNYGDKEAFDITWNNSFAGGNGLFVPSAGTAQDNTPKYQEFRHCVKLKDIVGKFMWYILVGVLVTSKSYNYILSEPCSLNPDVANKIAKQYQADNTTKTDPTQTPQGFAYMES